MLKAQPVYIKQHGDVKTRIFHFLLPGLLPTGRKLALHLETRTLSLLLDGPNGPELIAEQLFSVNEIRVLVPMLQAFPNYCPYEVLLSHISSNNVTEATVARCRQRLYEAQSGGTWQQELRPMRRALSSIRSKIHNFDLEVSNVRERGCSVTSLTSTPSSRVSS